MTVCATASSITWIAATVGITAIIQLLTIIWINRGDRTQCKPGACINTGQLDANCGHKDGEQK